MAPGSTDHIHMVHIHGDRHQKYQRITSRSLFLHANIPELLNQTYRKPGPAPPAHP
jgi:hypothetical protein